MKHYLMAVGIICTMLTSAWADDAFDNRHDKSPNPLKDSFTEVYVSGFAGINFAQPLSNVSGSLGPVSGTLSDEALKSSWVYGAKVGLFSADLPMLGFELEAFNSTPHLKQQNVSVMDSGRTTILGSTTVNGAHQRVTAFALNVILRYPGDTFQPYIGAGPAGFFFARSNGTDSSTSAALGFSGLAGLKVFLTKNWGLYGEYKFNHATFKESQPTTLGLVTDKWTYDAHMVVAGIAYHFSP